MNYPMIIYPCDEGGYVAEIPALKGCLARGERLAETLENWLSSANYGSKPRIDTDKRYRMWDERSRGSKP